MLAATAWSSSAQDQTFSATIALGDCGSDTVVAELTDLVLPTGADIGAATGRTAASSFTTVPVSFDQLTTADHAIQARDSCGPIGGSVNSTGALIVVLSGDGGDSGIAYLGPNAADPSQTDVSLFIAPPESAQSTANTGADEARAAIQGNVAENAVGVAADVPQGGFTAEEQRYLSLLLGHINTMTESLTQFEALVSNPKFGDEVWMVQMAGTLVTWQLLYGEVSKLTPPPAFVAVHAVLVEAFGLYSIAADDIMVGVDTLDSSRLEAGRQNLEAANLLVQEATRLMDEIEAARGQ